MAAPRWLHGGQAVSIRQTIGDHQALAALTSLGLEVPAGLGAMTGSDALLARLGATEWLALAPHRTQPLDRLAQMLAPRENATAVALDMSEGLAWLEWRGPEVADWLCRWLDASSLPAHPGCCTRGRFAEVRVTLLRPDHRLWWLLCDHSHRDYIDAWLAHADLHPD